MYRICLIDTNGKVYCQLYRDLFDDAKSVAAQLIGDDGCAIIDGPDVYAHIVGTIPLCVIII